MRTDHELQKLRTIQRTKQGNQLSEAAAAVFGVV